VADPQLLGYTAAFTAGLLFALSDVLVRVSTVRIKPQTMLSVSLIVGTPVLALASLLSGDPLPGQREALLYAAAGILNFVVGRLLFYYAVAGLGATTASIITSPTILIAAIMAWALLGEPLTPQTLAGLTLVLAGIIAASYTPSGRPLQGVGARKGLLAGAASTLVFASTSILIRAAGAAGGSPFWGATISYITALPIAVVLAFRATGSPRGVLPIGDPVLKAAGAAAVVVALAQLSRYTSLSLLPVAEAVILISLFPVHTAVLSVLFSEEAEERIGGRHLAGGLLSFAGILLALS